MKIAFLMNSFDRTDIIKYPRGVGYYMMKHLKAQGAEIVPIFPAVKGEFPYKIKQAIYKYIFHKNHLRFCELDLIKREAKIRSEILKNIEADFVLSFGPFASNFLETDKKIAWWTDAMFKGLENYNSDYTNLSQSTTENNVLIDKIGLECAQAIFFTSEWAKNIAIQESAKNANKYFVAPFGANIEINYYINFIENIVEKRLQDNICRLLLISVHWQRKGVDKAVAITKRLNELGLKSELTIIGCEPPKNIELPDFIKIIKFINTSTESGMKSMQNYYNVSHFFLMPTLAESFGHVFCEANALGLPCISHKTGGVSEVILDDKNGKTFEIGENIDHWCEYIIKIFEDKTAYKELCLTSFNEYQTRLNWDNGCKIVINHLQKLL